MINLIFFPFRFTALLIQSVFLALGQIWANKVRSVLTTIGIVIGVASVTAVIAGLTGLKAKVLSEFETIGSSSMFISPQWPDKGPMKHLTWHKIRFYPHDFDDLLEHCPLVERFTRTSWGRQNISYGEESEANVRVRGIDPAWHKINNRKIINGRPFSTVDQQQAWQVCVVTPEVRKELKLNKDCTGQCIFVGGRSFRIIGMVEEQGFLEGGGDSKAEIFVPFETAWKLWKPWMGVIAKSKTPEMTEEAKYELKRYMRRIRRLQPGDPDTFRIDTVDEFIQKFTQIAMIMTGVAGGIVSISLLVGGVGIMNIMLVSVSERTREIGLRKAVGARPSTILLQFLIEAVMLCMFGGLIGVGFGKILTGVLKSIPDAQLDQAYIPAWAIAIAFGFSAFVGVFFGMFPAVKAARLDPIEALRHE